jgi:hypothetical protein
MPWWTNICIQVGLTPTFAAKVAWYKCGRYWLIHGVIFDAFRPRWQENE